MTPVLAIEDGRVLVGDGDSVEPCGFGTLVDTDIVQLTVDEEAWDGYCDAVGSANPELVIFLFPSCESGATTVNDSGDSTSGEVTALGSPTPVVLLDVGDALEAKRNATASVFNLGTGDVEIPYDEVQFHIEKPHDGCSVEHVHAGFTVYAFEEWSRGSSGWKTNGELPLDDPDPDRCGFGEPESLAMIRVAANGQVFLNFCRKLREVGARDAMFTRCARVSDFVTR